MGNGGGGGYSSDEVEVEVRVQDKCSKRGDRSTLMENDKTLCALAIMTNARKQHMLNCRAANGTYIVHIYL